MIQIKIAIPISANITAPPRQRPYAQGQGGRIFGPSVDRHALRLFFQENLTLFCLPGNLLVTPGEREKIRREKAP